MSSGKRMDESSHLILQRTPREQLKEGVTIITRGRWVGPGGKRYLDLVAASPACHVGYGRKEITGRL
jgi:adenosylmethionine-8-amino-7-oxononanoate aminotransferase